MPVIAGGVGSQRLFDGGDQLLASLATVPASIPSNDAMRRSPPLLHT